MYKLNILQKTIRSKSYGYNPEITFTEADRLYLESVRLTHGICLYCQVIKLRQLHNNPKRLCVQCYWDNNKHNLLS